MKKRLAFFSVLLAATAALTADRQVITATTTIEAGDTLRILPGRELLFTDYTGLTVRGHLQALGTQEQIITFTSTGDTAGTGTPLDWLGIKIAGGGSAEFAYCYISNATSGITAEDKRSVSIKECVFENNGQWHLSLAGETQTVPAGKPYSYTPPTPPPVIPTPAELAAPTPATTPEAIPTPDAAKPKQDTRRTLRWALTGAGAAAAIGGGVALYSATQIEKEYNAYVPGNAQFDAATPADRQKHYDKLRKDHGIAQAVGWSLLIASQLELLYLVIFF